MPPFPNEPAVSPEETFALRTSLTPLTPLSLLSSILMKSNDGVLLYDLFLAFNRRLRVIIQKLHPPLALVESHLLGEINQQRIVNSTTLLHTLLVEKTKVSRTIASFLERKWIEGQLSHADRRVRYFTITPAGLDVYMQDNQLRNKQVIECLAPLSVSERKDLSSFINKMADALGASQILPLPGDVVGKVEIRRLTRAIGLLGDNLLNLQLPLDECQLMHIVHRDGNCVSMSTLKMILPYEMTLISRLTTSLAERNFVKKVPLPFDKRHIQVMLTPDGVARAQSNLFEGGKRLMTALTTYSASERHQFFSLLEKMVSQNVDSRGIPESSGLVVQDIQTNEARTNARTFVVETLVGQKRSHEIRESILHPDHICVQLSQLGTVQAVCEARVGKNSLSLLYFVASPELEDSIELQQLFASVIDRALRTQRTEKLALEGSELLPNRLRRAFRGTKKPEVGTSLVANLLSDK